MANKEIKANEIEVIFETITPLYTGDAWQESEEIRPSSLIGGLRFWFEIYNKICKNEIISLNTNGIPDEKLDYNKFKNKIYDLIKNNNFENFEQLQDEALKSLDISISSRVFGCTGWKSRIKIKDISYTKEILNRDEVNDKFWHNTGFWISKSLFNDKEKINVHKNIAFTILSSEFWFCNYLKNFLDFYSDKIVLLGGKKSFGFGFVKISYKTSLNCNSSLNECNKFSKYYFYENISLNLKDDKYVNQNNKKKLILGYNFRYFLRRKELKNNRIKFFGRQGEASSTYISFLSNENSSLKLIIIKNPFKSNDKSFQEEISEVASKFKDWLKELDQIQEPKNE
jgi:CRISPR-associated protein Cmr1